MALHANHPRELTAAARAACARLVDAGIVMLSQSVLLRGVNDDAEVLAALMRGFVETRIKPYYLHHPDLAPGTAHFRLSIEEGQALVRALRGRVSGLCQPTYVLDIPGGHGKAPIAAANVRKTGGRLLRCVGLAGPGTSLSAGGRRLMGFAISGVFCAAATPLDAELNPDLPRFVAHCRRLIAEGCDGVALLGTTGEANSFSVRERQQILEGVLAGGLTTKQLVPGVGVAAIPDTIELTRHALGLGVERVVMLPPFYYKGVSDDGLFASYARVIEGVGDGRLRVILYNIPQTSAVPLSIDLVARLIAAYPGTVVGIKDSSGNLANMLAMVGLDPDFAVLSGADPLMLPVLQAGGAGAITGTSNLIAPDLRTVFDGWADPSREAAVQAAQRRLEAWRTLTLSFTHQLAAIKAMLAVKYDDAGWLRVRPPLVPFTTAQMEDVRARMAALEEEV